MIPLELPPFRERREDMGFFACHFKDHFILGYGKMGWILQKGVLKELIEKKWLGNARELRKIIERGVLLSAGSNITQLDFLGKHVEMEEKGERIMKIDMLTTNFQDFSVLEKGLSASAEKSPDTKSFSEMLSEGMDRLNNSIEQANEFAAGLAAVGDVDVAHAMIAITKADISFKMFLQIRNKALSAYEEIMRLQF